MQTPRRNIDLRQQCRDAPLLLPVLVEDIPFDRAGGQGLQRLFEIELILAVEFNNPHQILDPDAMLFYMGQFIVGIGQQHVLLPPLQQGDIVLDMDRRTGLDDLFFFTHALPFSSSHIFPSSLQN